MTLQVWLEKCPGCGKTNIPCRVRDGSVILLHQCVSEDHLEVRFNADTADNYDYVWTDDPPGKARRHS